MKIALIVAALAKSVKGCTEVRKGFKNGLTLLVGSVLAQIFYYHRTDFNAFQIINSLLMWLSGSRYTVSKKCKKTLINLGDTLSKMVMFEYKSAVYKP